MDINGTHESLPLRDGHVSSYDPVTHTARIVFPDHDDTVSYPFPVLLPNTLNNRDEIHLDIGEHVMCLCMGNGVESGIVLGCVYDKKNPPTVGNRDRRVTIFEDGTHVFCDRKEHIFQIKDSYGSFILMKDGDIILQSSNYIQLNPGDAPETIGGHLAAQFD
ncbi:MAG: baseplate assembly protein [Synergistaceae bacterium]|jgi:phage baseplate assembly protein gpV|nr:baseplate assembly protein [Synergistaceae bacterium]